MARGALWPSHLTHFLPFQPPLDSSVSRADDTHLQPPRCFLYLPLFPPLPLSHSIFSSGPALLPSPLHHLAGGVTDQTDGLSAETIAHVFRGGADTWECMRATAASFTSHREGLSALGAPSIPLTHAARPHGPRAIPVRPLLEYPQHSSTLPPSSDHLRI